MPTVKIYPRRPIFVPMGTSLLPLSSVLRPTASVACWARATAVLIAIVAATGAHAILGIGGSSVEEPIRDWLTSAVYILVGVIVCWRAVRTTESRKSWMIFAFGISIYGLGNVLWAAWIEHLPNPPIPSICDGMWLTLYPCCYLGIVGLARLRERRVPARMWLDGIVAGPRDRGDRGGDRGAPGAGDGVGRAPRP